MKRLLDAFWLLLLGIFVFAGMPLATFHGDETYHIYTSRDYDTLFIERRPQDLLVHALDESDLGYQRLMNGGLIRYSIGFTRHLAGMSLDRLLPYGYQFGESYEENVARGLVPAPDTLAIYRIPSALFTALSVVVVFSIGNLYGGRRLAYVASALYALNPVILLNGRRAMQEGALLLFGLLSLYLALRIALLREASAKILLRWWAGLIFAGALALASKYNAFVYLAPAYLALTLPEVLRLRAAAAPLIAGLAMCVALTVLLFFALSPGWWYDPLARFQDVVRGRFDVIQSQVVSDPNAPIAPDIRAAYILTEPFMMPLQHAEIDRVAPQTEIDRYMASPLSGVQFGALFGGLLTLLTGFGLLAVIVPRLRLVPSGALATGLCLWLSVNVVTLMTNPLPWQRYYLALIPLLTLLTGIGLFSLWNFIRHTPIAQASHA